jgi:hypothetical protein
MYESITLPPAVAYRARARLMRAQEIVAAFSELYDHVALLFKAVPPAQEEDALTIRRAWLRASA